MREFILMSCIPAVIGCLIMFLLMLNVDRIKTKARKQEEKRQRQLEPTRQALRTIELYWKNRDAS